MKLIMEYCPARGNRNRHAINCGVFEKVLFETTGGERGSLKPPEMLPIMASNNFCRHCNKVFAAEVTNCSHCRRKLSKITDAHLKSDLLSGTGAAISWA
jgi:hypothetical protein